MCSDECCPPVPPDEATAERAALVERITDALVEFDREQHEGYGLHGPFSDRLARIARVNDAQHAAWAVLRHFVEGHGGIVGKLAADFYAATDEVTRLRAENEQLRRDAADQLSREGQEMRLGEPDAAMQRARISQLTEDLRWQTAETEKLRGKVGYWRHLWERGNGYRDELTAELREVRAELAEARTAVDAFHRSAAAMRRDRDRLSAGLRGMARRSNENRAEATYWASGDWQAENRELRKLIETERPSVGDMIIETARRRVELAAARAELATLRAGRASGAVPLDARKLMVELYRAELVRHCGPEILGAVEDVLAKLTSSDTPVPERFCAHHGDDNYIATTICAPPCGAIHARCGECHKLLDPCAHMVPAPPADQPEVVEPGETTVVPYLPLAEYKALMRSASAPSDRPSEPDQPEAVEPDVPWIPLMDEVHRQIEEAGADCPESDDDEPLCMSIAVGLWLQGWRTPSVAGPAYGKPNNGAPVDFNG